MTDLRSDESPLEAAAGAAGPGATDAFKRLANETRLAILLALWEAYEPFEESNVVPLSTLRAGRHARQGPVLLPPRQARRALPPTHRRGLRAPERGPGDRPGHHRRDGAGGDPLRSRPDRQSLSVLRDADRDHLRERVAVSGVSRVRGYLRRERDVPPGDAHRLAVLPGRTGRPGARGTVRRGRAPDDAPVRHDAGWRLPRVHRCGRVLDRRLRGPRPTVRQGVFRLRPSLPDPGPARLCGLQEQDVGPAEHPGRVHPDVVVFYADHDVDLGYESTDLAGVLRFTEVVRENDRAEFVSEDPIRVRVTFRCEGDELGLTIDETASVVAVDRPDP